MLIVAGSLSAGLVTACGTAGEPSEGSRDRPLVVTTTSILGDLVRNVVLDRAQVEVLIPTGADPHEYQLSSQQAARIRSADLVVANGLALEEGLDAVLDAAVAEGARILRVGPQLDPIPLTTADGAGDDVAVDPHVWMDLSRMARATGIIASALAEVAPQTDWAPAADQYAEDLLATDGAVQAELAAIPGERRVLVTTHDFMGYFAHRYGFEIAGVVIPGGSTLSDPSSSELADLLRIIDERDVPAIFTDTIDVSALTTALASDADVAVVELHGGSLGEAGSGAETLIELHQLNASRIVDALRP